MALPVLDGNQSATTLSSVVTGGEHIVAHSVVSLGTTAIANITSAVSGVNIGGTVTANINGTPTVTIPQLNKVIASVATDGVADATTNFVKIGGHQSGSNQTAHIVHVSTGGAMSVDATDSVVSISNFPSTQTIAGTVTANANLSNTFQDEYNTLLISGTLTGYWSDVFKGVYFRAVDGYLKSGWTQDGTRPKIDYDTAPSGEYSGQRWRLYSTEFASGDSSVIFYANSNTDVISAVTGWTVVTASGYSGTVNLELYFNVPVALNNTEATPIHIVGAPAVGGYPVLVNGTVTVGNSVTIGSLPSISGTVTVGNSVTIGSLPSGALTTRFGSVVTANLAQITSAVTNTSRKYLLAQNISAGTVTIGIGFSPTTTQGIQLTAGAGLTFDAFCPTGAVYWLGAVTGAAFTILEG